MIRWFLNLFRRRHRWPHNTEQHHTYFQDHSKRNNQ
jgi:hypothetical protein